MHFFGGKSLRSSMSRRTRYGNSKTVNLPVLYHYIVPVTKALFIWACALAYTVKTTIGYILYVDVEITLRRLHAAI
jgi:hypothetical protein